MTGNPNLPSVDVLVLEVVSVAAVGSRAARGPPEEAFLLQAATAPQIMSHFKAAFLVNMQTFSLCSRFLPGL